ncbi:major tail protein [Staphylococcus aureus]
MAKQYNSFTGLKGFHYKVQGEEVSSVEAIEYLQEVSVSKEQSIEKAYGDNTVAEMAVANGVVEVESTFHHLPLEDRTALFGLTQGADGEVYVGDNTPPYVSVIFEKTMESGAVEYVGLLKGKFMFSEVEGTTKEDGVEFSQDATTGEFMPTEIDGVEGKQAMILGRDEAGVTTMRDSIWQKVFGEAHPDAVVEPTV